MALSSQSYTDAVVVNDALKAQASLIKLQLQEEILQEDPYANCYEGGTVSPHEGETITTQLAGRPVLNKNMAAPSFVAKTSLCNLKGEAATFGSEQYTTTLQGDRGEGPTLCVHNLFHKLDRELEQHVMGLKRVIKEYVMSDHRYQLLYHSGFKYVCSTGASFNNRISGGEYLVDQNFMGHMPNAAITWKQLVRLCTELESRARMTKWGWGAGAHARLIGSKELINRLRDESNFQAEVRVLAQGGDADTIESFKAYTWEMPYRGITFAEDPVPLRFNSVNGSGFPNLLVPYENKVGNSGEHWVTNDEWINGDSEVAFLVWKGSFRKLVPEQLTDAGGGASFPAQGVFGDLEWLNQKDMVFNQFGDLGKFIYQIIRAVQPIRPWCVCPLLTKRCSVVDDISACADSLTEA